MLRVFIGYDSKEIVAYHTCVQSLLDNVSQPVAIIPILKDHLRDVYKKQRKANESTEFSMTRFLTPYLSEYKGHSLFVDCDVIFRADPYDLVAYTVAYPEIAVFVVQHDYTPSTQKKFLNQPQAVYPKKNWSSVMMFNNELCRSLTPDYVNHASGMELHQFKWLANPNKVGNLPKVWNHLVGEYDPNPDAKIAHFTMGTPCFSGYDHQEFADEWFDIMRKAVSSREATFQTIRNEIRNDPALAR